MSAWLLDDRVVGYSGYARYLGQIDAMLHAGRPRRRLYVGSTISRTS